MSEPNPAPSQEEAVKSNGLPAELSAVGEASARLNARVEAYAKELDESEKITPAAKVSQK